MQYKLHFAQLPYFPLASTLLYQHRLHFSLFCSKAIREDRVVRILPTQLPSARGALRGIWRLFPSLAFDRKVVGFMGRKLVCFLVADGSKRFAVSEEVPALDVFLRVCRLSPCGPGRSCSSETSCELRAASSDTAALTGSNVAFTSVLASEDYSLQLFFDPHCSCPADWSLPDWRRLPGARLALFPGSSRQTELGRLHRAELSCEQRNYSCDLERGPDELGITVVPFAQRVLWSSSAGLPSQAKAAGM